MTIDADDEILQDFLVEAGELLEQLNEQLVELEQRPQDVDLLNAVFRGFHTVKGGAGFLGLDALVAVCHRAEDVFNVLRQGERQTDAELMDAVLKVLDEVNSMFSQVQAGEDPAPAPPELLAQLEALARSRAPANEPPPAAPAEPETVESGDGDITDDEFEALLDAAQAGGGESAAAGEQAEGTAAEGDDITDDEFEALLDQLHGQGSAPAGPVAADPAPAASAASSGEHPDGDSDETITDDEFEALLDELHGKVPDPPAHKPAPEAAGTVSAPAATAAKAAAPAKPAQPQAEASVRVDTKRLDDIMNLVGELVLARNRLSTLRASRADEEIGKAVANLDVVTADLQAAVMKTRMQPIKKVFGRFPRVVRDIARNLHKEVVLEMQGEETDLDKNLVEALADPLVHLVRNAVDHGLEGPEEREAAGKPRVGTVVLSAEQEGDHILLSIHDDGKGMDPDALRRKAVEKGLMDQESASRLDDRECWNLIFMPGFSTKSEISDISGRGVGMDVVKTRIAQLNGTVDIQSGLGKGTCISIRVPLTLAIMPTLMVVLGQQTFALPLASVSEIFNLDASRTNVVDGRLVVIVREKALPLFYLRSWLVSGHHGSPADMGHVVVVHVGNQRVGFVVDQLIGQEEVVIKPLGSLLHGLAGFAGATITGDGNIALILDVPSLMKKYAQRM
ncbi:MAG TPA: chemotaxis protein CheA [Gammaproteobacteria bacterium]|nr:chemotaxis protein CheA [Gammaproteobacteria bacterium]